MAVTLVWSAACTVVWWEGRVGPGLAGGSSQCGTGVLWICGDVQLQGHLLYSGSVAAAW